VSPMNHRANHCPGVPLLVAGWCALLLYAGAVSPLGLEVAVLIGAFDRTHHVSLCAGARGVQLVLHHDGNSATHKHGTVARVLTCFAQPASAVDPDHVIQFTTSDNIRQTAQLAAPRPAIFEQPDFAPVGTGFCEAEKVPFSLGSFHPPPKAHAQLRCLRSTVLLI